MGNKIKILTKLHKSTSRNYSRRMSLDKPKAMTIAKKYNRSYWDGKRKYGYGGYKYINGYWKPVALKLIKKYKLSNSSKIIDIGCGKGYLLFELKKLLPKIKITGIDISSYAISNCPKEIRKHLMVLEAQNKYPFKNKYFDLAISLGCIHNLNLNELQNCIKEINRVSKKQYLMTESYRSNKELYNLQCWALTCNLFFSETDWKWIFSKLKFKGDYEFIYFE